MEDEAEQEAETETEQHFKERQRSYGKDAVVNAGRE